MKLGLRVGHYPQQFDELDPSLTSPTETGNTGLSWLYLLFLLLLFLLSSLQVAKRSHSVSDRSTAVPWYRHLEQVNEHGRSAVYRQILRTPHTTGTRQASMSAFPIRHLLEPRGTISCPQGTPAQPQPRKAVASAPSYLKCVGGC